MKRKLTLIAVAASAAVALLFTSCMTGSAARYVASGLYIAGSDFATWQLQRDPNALKGLLDLATALQDIPLGKVTPFQMGALNRELWPLKQAADAKPKDAAALTRIGNLISAASQQLSGQPTVIAGMAMSQCADFANGINSGIEFYKGQQSVSIPFIDPRVKASNN